MRIASNPSRNISTNDSMNRLAGEPRSATSRHARLLSGLERAERLVADRGSAANLFMESFVLLLREGFEAILIVAALRSEEHTSELQSLTNLVCRLLLEKKKKKKIHKYIMNKQKNR